MSAPGTGERWVVVAGPTASGKTEVALELAERFGGEIVNADSRQVYRRMDVGTAKPTATERARLPHHLFDILDPDQDYDAARYRDDARAAVRAIQARGALPVVVGGTGLYLRALARGFFRGPSAVPALRRALERLEEGRPGSLVRWCRRLDPAAATRVHGNDTVRLVRAIEVALVLGRPISRAQRDHAFEDHFGRPLWVVLEPEAAALENRIAERSRAMLEGGLLEELEGIWAEGFDPGLRVLGSIGYREAATVLRGEATLEQAVVALVRSTRQFARRQRAWFRSERSARTYDPASDLARIVADVDAWQRGS